MAAHMDDAWSFMHCLPAHRGEEVTDWVMDHEQSIVFDQAENRMWAQMSLTTYLINQGAWDAMGEFKASNDSKHAGHDETHKAKQHGHSNTTCDEGVLALDHRPVKRDERQNSRDLQGNLAELKRALPKGDAGTREHP